MEGLQFFAHKNSLKLKLKIKFIMILIIFCSFIDLTATQTNNARNRVEFRATHNKSKMLEFRNIAVENKKNGLIYVGARNRLFQLNSNLNLIDNPIVTGPVDNNLVCRCTTKNQTDNLNKLLLIDHKYGRVIVCGSVEQGVCELRQQGNLNYVLRRAVESISGNTNSNHVAASKNLSTVAFVATVDSEEYLYVGSSKTYLDDPVLNEKSYTSFYTIARRALPEDNLNKDMFSNELVSASSTLDHNGITMNSRYASQNFRLNFINSFATDITGYFVVTHPSSLSNSNEQDATYISQVCLGDPGSSTPSYLELPLECTVDGVRYTKAIASTTGKVGTLLQQQLGYSTSNIQNSIDVVFVSFAQSNNRPGSALCMFPLPEIEQKYVKMVSDCMKSQSSETPSHISWIKHRTSECNDRVS